MMKRLLLVLLVGCSSAPSASPGTDEGRARELVAKLVKHDFAGAVAAMDDHARAKMPEAKLAAIWSQLEQQVGALKQIDSADVQAGSASIHNVTLKATFERAPLVIRIGVDADGKIGALWFTAADSAAAAAYAPPPYAKPDTFDEVEVKVGKLPGTLSLPKHATHVPAVVLVHGSGPNDRDEHIGAQAPFKDIAWGLASRGIAVLRYDKRTKVDPSAVRTQREEVDEAAHAAVALLAARPEIDPARIALLGHSQGGYLAPRIASDDPAIKRLVILAGPTRSLEDSLVAQYRYMATLKPGDAKIADGIRAAEQLKAAIEDPALGSGADLATPFGNTIPGSYFLDVRGYHPEQVAAKLAIPILVLQGERDYQVTLADDFPAWKAALEKHPNVTFHTYPTLGHPFTLAGTPASPADYAKPEHVDEHVIDDLAAFLSAP